MPLARGTVRAIASPDPETVGALVITNDRWNAVYPGVGVIPLRRSIAPYEEPYSHTLRDGRFAVAARLGAVLAAPDSASPLGPVEAVLSSDEIAEVEDRLCAFLQLPPLLGRAPRQPRIVGRPTYPLWGEIYLAEPLINGERKPYIVVSPNTWNAVSGLVTLVRTTSVPKRGHAAFPTIQGGKAHACCGEANSVPHGSIRRAPRDRPVPSVTTLREMSAVVRGFIVTHQLQGALARAGVRVGSVG